MFLTDFFKKEGGIRFFARCRPFQYKYFSCNPMPIIGSHIMEPSAAQDSSA